MRRYRKILATATVIGFSLTMLMICCWQKAVISHHQLAKVSHLPACHQKAATDKSAPGDAPSSCQCQQLVSVVPAKSMMTKHNENGYLKWTLESSNKAQSIVLFSFSTDQPAMAGPPHRYAFLTPLYLKYSVFRI